MLKAYKYRIYPTKEQEEYLSKVFGCVRFIYTKIFYDKIEYYKQTGEMLKNTPAQCQLPTAYRGRSLLAIFL
ncbi:MAG: helix-turn-helix domain-containing protein [Candidatus Diapherotrites archaeon]|nr:helix-turn-helix domain-containing protein [Candidatus Diapherotrites archaeon]